MYVLMDIEWFELKNRRICPTQIAALRVDDRWASKSMFQYLMRPPKGIQVPWNHVAFSGVTQEAVMEAYSAYTVFERLERWLQLDDVLCWWREEPAEMLDRLMKIIMGRVLPQERRILSLYYAAYENKGRTLKASLYTLARRQNLSVPSVEHCSRNDVVTMQLFLF